MSSLVYEIKFKNYDHFVKENENEFKALKKEDFNHLELKAKDHKIFALNPNNSQSVVSFTADKITYGFDQNEKFPYNSPIKKFI